MIPTAIMHKILCRRNTPDPEQGQSYSTPILKPVKQNEGIFRALFPSSRSAWFQHIYGYSTILPECSFVVKSFFSRFLFYFVSIPNRKTPYVISGQVICQIPLKFPHSHRNWPIKRPGTAQCLTIAVPPHGREFLRF